MSIEDDFHESAKLSALYIKSEKGKIELAIEKTETALKSGNKLLICGNGGSAADAQHFAAELVGMFNKKRKPLPAIALTTNTSNITAAANDFGFEYVFERQLEALGRRGDVLFAISTSGNSANVLRAVLRAKSLGIFTIALLGKGGGRIGKEADLPIIVPSDRTPRIQECHLITYHAISERIENDLFPGA
jgi:D-sedoheptulose 7-phosphate isomerase